MKKTTNKKTAGAATAAAAIALTPRQRAEEAIQTIISQFEKIQKEYWESRENLSVQTKEYGAATTLASIGSRAIEKEALWQLIHPIWSITQSDSYKNSTLLARINSLKKEIGKREDWTRAQQLRMSRSTDWLENAISQHRTQIAITYVFCSVMGFVGLRARLDDALELIKDEPVTYMRWFGVSVDDKGEPIIKTASAGDFSNCQGWETKEHAAIFIEESGYTREGSTDLYGDVLGCRIHLCLRETTVE
jgi:hypothetical protein